jgi:isopenicillin N synthase-like dioxygenase
MRLLHYPPQYGEVDDRVIGIGAHTDWECFTILWQQPDIQALQVLSPQDKKWIGAPPVEGTLVINLGDQFARWTNDIFQSNVHRAINRSGVERYSIPLFFGTDYDVALEVSFILAYPFIHHMPRCLCYLLLARLASCSNISLFLLFVLCPVLHKSDSV